MNTTMGTRDNSRWRKECYERSYDQRITIDHGKWCIRYDGTSVQRKVHDSPQKRIDYDMTYSIDQYISSIEPPIHNKEGIWYSTPGGVTIEDI